MRPEELPLPAPSVAAPSPPVARRVLPTLPRPLALLWAAMVAGVVLFLAFGSLRVGAGLFEGRRLPVREIWSRFVSFLIEQGASPLMVGVVTVLAALTLVGAAVALWLALGLRNSSADTPDSPA